jgi:hypothetical protein
MTATETSVTSSSSPRLNRWLLGTAAFGSATAVQAEIVQIDLAGNKASIDGSNFVNNTSADITGDGIDDFDSSSFYFRQSKVKGGGFGVEGAVNGNYVSAFAQRFFSRLAPSTSNVSQGSISTSFSSTEYRVNAGNSMGLRGSTPQTARNFIVVRFEDPRINDGVRTNALLEVRAANLDFDSHEIELVRVVFDDADPEAKFEASLETQYPLWGKIADSVALPQTTSRLEKKIAALEKKIRQAKAAARPNTPRLNFYRTQANRIRQIAALERQLAALKRKQRGRG